MNTDSASIKKRVQLQTVAALFFMNLLAIGLVAQGLQEIYKRDIHQAEVRSQNIALAVEQTLTAEIEKVNLSLQTIVAELETDGGKTSRNVQKMVELQNLFLRKTEGWSVTDKDGKVIAQAGELPFLDFMVGDRPYFQELRQGRWQLVVSKPLTSRLSGQPILILSRAYRDRKGNFAGAVIVPFPLAYLQSLIEGFNLGKNGAVALRDKNLGLVVRVPEASPSKVLQNLGDANVSEPFRNMASRGEKFGTYQAHTPHDQLERIHSFRYLAIANIYIIAAVSKDDFLAEWRSLCRGNIVLLLLMLAIANTAVWLTYRQFSRQRQLAADLRLTSDQLAQTNQELEASLCSLEERDSALVSAQEAGGLGTFTIELTTQTWSSSAQLDALYGIDEVYPRTWNSLLDLMPADDQVQTHKNLLEAAQGIRQFVDHEFSITRPLDQRACWFHALGKLELDADGKPLRIRGTIQDITERKQSEERLNLTQNVFLSASEGILVTNEDGTIQEVNPSFTAITGYSYEEAIGHTPRILKSGKHAESEYGALWSALLSDGFWEGEFINRRKNGELYVQQTRISSIRDEQGKIKNYVSLIFDITEFKKSLEELQHLAFHDKLTGLANRGLLVDRLRQAIARSNRSSSKVAICYIDVDGFKPVNDIYGSNFGDRVLVELSQRLTNSLRAGDTVARLGGDEFVVLLNDINSESGLTESVARVMQCFQHKIPLERRDILLTASCGVTVYPSDKSEAEVLIRHADQAMYEAKRQGKNRVQYFDSRHENELLELRSRHQRLATALENNEFCVYYQPKVVLESGKVVGLEALMRWNHPDEGLLAPVHFIPVMEATDLAAPAGEWLLHEVLRQKVAWQAQGINLNVSINVFASHLHQEDFPLRLQAILNQYPEVLPNGIELEILETTVIENIETMLVKLHACKSLGVKISLDDFGTGYSSLSYLRRLPVDTVKIDRSFILDMLKDPDELLLVESIVYMAKTLEREVIAEGVETIEHGIPLLRFGCDQVQGFGIARPMPADSVPNWLESWRPPAEWSRG